MHGLRGIPHVRLERGLKQHEMATELDVPRNYLSDVECGRRAASVETLIEWSETLGTTVDALIFSPDELKERTARFHERATSTAEPTGAGAPG